MILELQGAKKQMNRSFDDDFLDQELNNQTSIIQKLGIVAPVLNFGGISFGSYIFYKTVLDKVKLPKFLKIQYLVFSSGLIAFNTKFMSAYIMRK